METTMDSTTSASSPLNEEFLSNQNVIFFTSFDYALFAMMLATSTAIGIYFGFFAKNKQNTTSEYLLGGKKMKFFPIAASLIASHVNGYTLLAVPSEIYGHGSEYTLCVISALLVSTTTDWR